MAAPKESIGFGVTLDAKQASGELEKLRVKSSKAFEPFDAKGALGGAQARVEKLATAVSGTASVFGGFGSKVGASFGALSNLASLVIAGGPLALGFAGLSFAVAEVAQLWEQNEENARQFAETLDKTVANASARGEATLKTLHNTAESVFKRLANFGLDQTQIAIFEAQSAALAAEERIGNLRQAQVGVDEKIAAANEKITRAKQSGLRTDEREAEAARERIVLYERIKSANEGRLEAQHDILRVANKQADAADDLLRLIEEQKRKAAAAARARRRQLEWEEDWRERFIDQDAEFEANERDRQREYEKFISEQERQEKAMAEDVARSKVEWNKWKNAQIEEQERVRFERQLNNNNLLVAETTAAFQASTAIMTNAITGVIDGEALAIEKAGLALVAMVGSELVAKGTAGLFKGAMMNAEAPGSGAPLMAVSAAAVGAGTGMAAGSAVGSAALQRAHASGKYRSITSATGVNVGLARLFGDQDGTPDIQGPAALDVSEQDDFGAGRVVDRERVQLIFNSAFYEGRQGALDMMQDAEDANKYQLRTR